MPNDSNSAPSPYSITPMYREDRYSRLPDDLGDLIDWLGQADGLKPIELVRVATQLQQYGFDPNDPDIRARAIKVLEERAEAAGRPRQFAPPQTLAERNKMREFGEPMVYYLDLYGVVIKIGYSGNVAQRVRALRQDVTKHLLAVERGGYDRESLRHEQFKTARRGTSEDFERTPELLAHIDHLRATVGEPTDVLRAAGLLPPKR